MKSPNTKPSFKTQSALSLLIGVNHYGEYADIPKSVALGKKFTIQGKLSKSVHLKSIDLRWEELPKPMTIAELNKTYSYGIPDKITASYFCDPTQTNDPFPLKTVDGQEEFSAEIATDKSWQPGLYYICLFAELNGSKEEQLISVRTIVFSEQ